jgi:hypothetical protein
VQLHLLNKRPYKFPAMFSAIKRLAGKAEGGNNVARPGHQSMSHSLQRKFAKGVQYNSKYYKVPYVTAMMYGFFCAFSMQFKKNENPPVSSMSLSINKGLD